MTPRQARTERRTAERKAKKLESKKAKLEAAAAPEHFPPTSGGFVSHDRALAKIFPPDVVAESIAFREKVLADLDAKPDTSKRAEINRANSQHSTGPRSPAGKLASSRNAVKHGLASGQMIIPGEDTAAFETLLHDLLEEHQPANPTEELLINELAQSHWLTQRAIRFQNECFTENGVAEERTGRSLPVVRVAEERTGRSLPVVRVAEERTGRSLPVVRVAEKRLALFLRYQTTHERAFHKALNTLMKLKKERRKLESGFVSHKTSKPGKQPGFVSQQPPNQNPKRTEGPPNPASIPQNANTNEQITAPDQKAEAA